MHPVFVSKAPKTYVHILLQIDTGVIEKHVYGFVLEFYGNGIDLIGLGHIHSVDGDILVKDSEIPKIGSFTWMPAGGKDLPP
jgi:hypothetical protein